MYSGLYRSILNEIGRPLTRAMVTACQSSSVGFSTTAHPCRYGLFCPPVRPQDEAVAGLPDRVLDHVPDLDLALPLPGEVQAHGLLLPVVAEGQRLQGP